MTVGEKITRITKILERNIDTDNLNRAKQAFKNLSEVEMNREYAHGGRTCKQILDSYKQAVDEAKELLEWFTERNRIL